MKQKISLALGFFLKKVKNYLSQNQIVIMPTGLAKMRSQIYPPGFWPFLSGTPIPVQLVLDFWWYDNCLPTMYSFNLAISIFKCPTAITWVWGVWYRYPSSPGRAWFGAWGCWSWNGGLEVGWGDEREKAVQLPQRQSVVQSLEGPDIGHSNRKTWKWLQKKFMDSQLSF